MKEKKLSQCSRAVGRQQKQYNLWVKKLIKMHLHAWQMISKEKNENITDKAARAPLGNFS